MTTSPQLPDRLATLGVTLRDAAAADLARARAARLKRRRTRLLGAVAAAVVAVPGVAVGASLLLSPDEVARSLPNGTLALLGTKPTCTTVREGVEFDCRLATAPQGDVGPGQWKGTVEPTVDDSHHVNGGCRSLDGAGTHWRCYAGHEAVRQQIISEGFLGQPSAGPGVG